ncbi:uncharacterized protein LOC121987837 [Zingiber officinale]|uniref:Uncharacterized protein n=1 Tax=Zingiber officinale TaxID=94328 RepID=A0A8J5GFZ3_ZINOF|nr:uncharacterized protein LOC121987837 [Zingiber officinale]KAG6505100.1 hypothetical protein ZIOFF_037448 [Zingiber officinale]
MRGAVVRKRVRREGKAAPPSSSPAKRGLPSDDLSRRRPGGGTNDPALAEAAGTAAAGCAALCCCCPCALLSLLFAVALKLPAALLRRALTRRRRKCWARTGVWKTKSGAFRDGDDDLRRRDWGLSSEGTTWPAISQCRETAELEKEMLSKFRSAGFWRSLSRSQRE